MSENHHEITISQPRLLQSDYVHMKDEQIVCQKLNKIINDDTNKLQFVTDFNSTITKQHNNGAPVPNSMKIFFGCKTLPASCIEENLNLYKKYSPFVLGKNISVEEGNKAMNEWFTQVHKSLQGINFDRKEVAKVVKPYSHLIRNGTQGLFAKLSSSKIPVLVFSAGIGDVIEATLRHQGILFDNVKLLANFLKYEGDIINGFKNPDRMVNIFNKRELAAGHDYFKSLKGRTNAILLCDTLSDAKILDEVETVDTVLKIGFFYKRLDSRMSLSKYERKLSSFKNVFDIVLEDDQTMNVLLELMTFVIYKI